MDNDKGKPSTSKQYRSKPIENKQYLHVEQDLPAILEILHGEYSDGDLSDLSDEEIENDDTSFMQRLDFLNRKRVGVDKMGRDDVLGVEDESVENTAVEEEIEEESSENTVNESNRPSEEDIYSMLTPKESIRWKRKSLVCSYEEYTAPDLEEPELLSPVHYFKRYVPDELFSTMETNTNIYALQQGRSSFKQTTASEIEVLFALHILAGTLKFPRIHMYWDRALKVNVFQENMSRYRFFELRTNLHIVNNLEKPSENKDKFFKVRPIYTAIRKRCNELPVEENVCVDEGIIPFTGKLSAKQYIKGKPNPWGIKMFMLCGKSGIVHDFLLYQGSTTELDENCCKRLGLAPAVVLQLSKQILDGTCHKLYFDNYFSSYHLFQVLKEYGIKAAGTVRLNRFGKNIPFSDDKTLMKQPRGYCEEVASADDIFLCKWLDNKPVVLGSNFIGKGLVDEVDRWEKKKNMYVKVERPEIVRRYNHAMGGVDLFDQLISYYRIFVKSRKWTLRMIFHAVDFAIAQSWLEYRRDAGRLGVPKNKQLDLLHFRIRLADGLIMCQKKLQVKKRGRPSTEGVPSDMHVVQRKKGELRPAHEIQFDAIDHFPLHDDGAPSRCKYPQCKGRSRIQCQKCKVHLCLQKDRNCFLQFHVKQ